jgi:uncharacterized protein YndB with AHSA1/START domain
MTENAVVHSTFTIERTYTAAPARVFAAFANEATKRRWFASGPGSEVEEFSVDFRVGGREKCRFRLTGPLPEHAPPVGTQMGNDTTYLDIVPDERIVFAYTMSIAEKPMSASLSTVELSRSGTGTRLTFTEQVAFFDRSDGPKLREAGWRELLQKLDDEVSKSS